MAYSLRGRESKVARESPPVFTEIYQHPPGNNRESSRGRQAAREKNRVLGGGRDPPQNPIFFCFFKGFGCSEGSSRCRLRGFFRGCFFRVGFLPGVFPKPKTKTPNPKPCLFFKLFSIKMTLGFCLFFNEKHAWLCLKNKEKTAILNAAPQYRVGVF